MVRLFDVQNGKVIASEHCYTLKFLKDIMDNYPEEYLRIYMYLFYMTCPNPDMNPFFDVPETDKEELILKEIDADFSTDERDIIYALDMCRKMYETPTYRAYLGIKIFLDNMARSLATEQLTFGRDGSSPALLRMAERYDEVRQSFKGVYRDLMEEQQSSVRGGQRLAYDQ
jgi:hypothetical protein